MAYLGAASDCIFYEALPLCLYRSFSSEKVGTRNYSSFINCFALKFSRYLNLFYTVLSLSFTCQSNYSEVFSKFHSLLLNDPVLEGLYSLRFAAEPPYGDLKILFLYFD